MAKTYQVITDEITALDCPITKSKIQTLYQDILDFANQIEIELTGGFDISDIGIPANPVNPFGIVQSVVQQSGGDFTNIKVVLNQTITGDYQPFVSIQWLGGGSDANVYYPLITEKTSNSFAILFNEGSGANQNLRIYFRIQKI